MIDKERLDAHLANGKTEWVMCAANWYNDGKDHPYQPYNIPSGYVICGWRHPCCGYAYMGANPNAKAWDRCEQGFLTTKNRFLTRSETLELVISTGQHDGKLIGSILTSEDLW